MAGLVKWRILFCVLVITMCVDRVIPSQEVMKKLTIKFSQVLDQCKAELNLSDSVMQDFFNFWREEYQLVNSDMGCAIMCMAAKFNLVDNDNKLHHGNAHEFAKTHGADDEMAKQLVSIIHECENTHAGITDDCTKILEIAKCFRTKIHGLKWAPSMEVVLEEVMTEV